MTDLERARALIQYWKDCEQYVGQHMSLSTNFETLVPLIAAALAATRREGYEDGRAAGLEEAAQTAENLWSVTGKEFADAIRALPLTPEEPT